MGKVLRLLAVSLLMSTPAWAQYDGLIISEVVHGTNSNGQPKYVELYNAAADTSYALDGLQIRTYFNGSSIPGNDADPELFVLDLGEDNVIDPGEAYVAAYSSSQDSWNPDWGTPFEVPPDITHFRTINGNGNDVYELYDTSSETTIDIYGIIGEVTSSSDYSPTWSYYQRQVTRRSVFNDGNDGTFVRSEWEIVPYTNSGATPGSHIATPFTELPVELVSFDVVADGDGAAFLRWQTATEQNNAGFYVEHRRAVTADARTSAFVTLGFVDGHGTTTSAHAYTFRTDGLAPGDYTFRLRQVDRDGTASYSETVELEVTAALPEGYRLSPAYPNPFNPRTQFTLQVETTQEVRVEVFNLLGQRVRLLHDGPVEGGQARTFTFEAADLPSGLYLYRAEGETFVASSQITLIK